MSKGSKIVPIRIDAALLALIQEEIERSENTRSDAPYDMSSYIRKAIADKLAHSKRSRAKRSKRSVFNPDGVLSPQEHAASFLLACDGSEEE